MKMDEWGGGAQFDVKLPDANDLGIFGAEYRTVLSSEF
jgi:hypothetical protein